MGQALYRKHRSRAFSEVVGQDHIIKTLQSAIKSGRISHAYLFTGPKGVGKTSVARILAHEINNLPYTDESIHLDIIEIDGASNRRIDEIRDLRDRVNISPTSAKYKVYIIDEVHMLTREAFNALLKTLEEPPAHCVFILATTEAHKLPETIISRTQRFEFKPISLAEVSAHLKSIAKQEKLPIDQEALELLAEYGEGSFRDSINLLDQLGSSGHEVTGSQVRDLLGLPPKSSVIALADNLYSGDSRQILDLLEQLRQQGVNSTALARLLGRELRARLLSSGNTAWLAPLLIELIEVPASARPDDALEISLLGACLANPLPTHVQPSGPISPTNERPTSNKEQTPRSPKASNSSKLDSQRGKFSLDSWQQILTLVRDQAASLYTALRLAIPSLDGDTLELAFQFPLHQKKVNQATHKDLIAKIIEEQSGQKLTINCMLNRNNQSSPDPAETFSKISASAPAPPEPTSNVVQTISNIFGGGEVLESGE